MLCFLSVMGLIVFATILILTVSVTIRLPHPLSLFVSILCLLTLFACQFVTVSRLHHSACALNLCALPSLCSCHGQDETSWNISIAAGVCLNFLSVVIQDDIVGLVSVRLEHLMRLKCVYVQKRVKGCTFAKESGGVTARFSVNLQVSFVGLANSV